MRIDLLRLSGALSAAKPARPPIGRARGLILALGLGAALWALIIWIGTYCFGAANTHIIGYETTEHVHTEIRDR